MGLKPLKNVLARKKNARGSIFLSAKVDGPFLNFSIKDDGRGLNLSRLRKKLFFQIMLVIRSS